MGKTLSFQRLKLFPSKASSFVIFEMTLRESTTCFFIFKTQESTFKIVGKYD